MSRRPAALLSVLLATSGILAIGPQPLSAQESCGDLPGYDRLDFWLGEWDVFSGERRVGTNRISKILDGCAVMEEWEGASGGTGRSLFYYHPGSEEWKQVWVTSTSFRVGGVKEKTLVEVVDGGGVRFEGRVSDAAGEEWIDRTTLEPLTGGRVRQVIEISAGGVSWETVFDAVYVPSDPS